MALTRADGPGMCMHGCWSLDPLRVKYEEAEPSSDRFRRVHTSQTSPDEFSPVQTATVPSRTRAGRHRLGMPETGGHWVDPTTIDWEPL